MRVFPVGAEAEAPEAEPTAAEVAQRGLQPETLVVRRSTLEDVFLRLTGRTLVD